MLGIPLGCGIRITVVWLFIVLNSMRSGNDEPQIQPLQMFGLSVLGDMAAGICELSIRLDVVQRSLTNLALWFDYSSWYVGLVCSTSP